MNTSWKGPRPPRSRRAVPDDGAAPSRSDIHALVALFEQHRRIPRVEYVPTAAPEVEATVQHDAYGQAQPAGPPDVARLRATVARGGLVAVARDVATGTAVGSGLVDRIGPGTATGELAAVGVLAAYRRRGIASALSAMLARTAHAHGMSLVWLEAEPEEESIYRRTGFPVAGRKLWMSRR